MSKITIHVGLHKTATTFLQTAVFPYAENTTFVSRPFTQLNHAFNKLQYADDSLYCEKEFIKEVQNINTVSNADNLIFSDESFSGKPTFFSYVNRSIIAKRFANVFPEAQVILFIRDQKDIMVSHYNSYIKMPYGTKKIQNLFRYPDSNYEYEEYLDSSTRDNHSAIYYNTNDYHIHPDCFKYTNLIKTYQNCFENLHVFTYEQLRNDIEGVVLNLEKILGQKINVKSVERENASLSKSMLAKRRVLNNVLSSETSKYVRKAGQIALNVIPTLPSKNLRDTIDDHIGSYFSEDNQELKLLLPDINWADYPDKYR